MPFFQQNNTILPHDDECCEICDQYHGDLEAFAKAHEETPLTNREVEFVESPFFVTHKVKNLLIQNP